MRDLTVKMAGQDHGRQWKFVAFHMIFVVIFINGYRGNQILRFFSFGEFRIIFTQLQNK
jgi:hypothetical protein